MPVLDHVEFLVEEPSAEEALYNLVSKILGQGFSFNIHPHQGKHDLLKKLRGRLRGYRTAPGASRRFARVSWIW